MDDVDQEQPRGKGSRVFTILFVIVIVLVVLGAVTLFQRRTQYQALAKETETRAIPTVAVIHASVESTEEDLVLPGAMQAYVESPIYARTNGYLKKWYHDIGSRVRQGDLLAEIDTPEVDQQLQQARANLNTAQANHRLSQITANRYQDLKNTDSVARQDVDNAMGDFQAKAAMVASAEYQVKYLEQLESFKNIYAPFDGVITARNTDIGQLIDSGSSGGAAKALFQIAATRTLRVYVSVPQQYSQAAKPGLPSNITLAEFPGRQFHGNLVRHSGAIAADSRTLLVEVDVDNPTGELLPGAYGEVHLKLPADIPSFILPVNALIFRSEGLRVAIVSDGNHANLVPITLGRDFGNEVEVVAGLTGEEIVITSPPDSLVSGEQVRIAVPAKGDNSK